MSADLRQLQHLVLLAEELNFGRAARRAHLSQSAFTRSIQALEAGAGLRLVDRGSRHVRVTPAGERAVDHARRLLAGMRDMARDLEHLRTGALGHVAVGAGPFATRVLLAPLIRELLAGHPGVTARLDVLHARTVVMEQLRCEAIDFFVGSLDPPLGFPDIDIRPLGRVAGAFYVRAGHPLLRKRRVTGTDLAAACVATVNLSDGARCAIVGAAGDGPEAARVVAIESDNFAMLVDLVLSSDLVLAAAHAVPPPRNVAPLRALEVEGLSGSPALSNDIALARLAGRSLTPAAEMLYASVLETTRRAAAPGGWVTLERSAGAGGPRRHAASAA